MPRGYSQTCVQQRLRPAASVSQLELVSMDELTRTAVGRLFPNKKTDPPFRVCVGYAAEAVQSHSRKESRSNE
jgi:hypothetical protein